MFVEIFCFVVALVFTRVVWMRWKYDVHKIPTPPRLPILGHTLAMANGCQQNFTKWFRKEHQTLGCPKIVRMFVGLETWVLITDAACIKTVVNNKTNPLPRYANMKTITAPIICIPKSRDTLLVSADEIYAKEIRKAYANGLSTSQLKKGFPKMKSVLDQMIKIIESKRKEGPVDIQKLCVKFALDSMGAVVFETNLGGFDGSRNIYEGIIHTGYIGREFIMNVFLKAYCSFFPKSKAARKRAEIVDKLTNEWDKLTKEIVERPAPHEDDSPLWHNLRIAVDPKTNQTLPYEVLRSELAILVLGGMDSTGHQLSWVLAMVASHPEIAEKIIQELEANGLYGSNCKEVRFEDLGNLLYLNAVIKEGFRIAHALTSSIYRQLPEDMTLLGYRLPKGTLIGIPSNRAINTKSDWGDPETVRPERWLTDEDMSSKFFWIFLDGPRGCPGQRLAMLEIRLAIVELISRYQFTTDKTFHQLLDNSMDGFMIESKDGIWLQVSPRHPSI